MKTKINDKTTVVINNEIALATNVMENTYSICGKRIASVPIVLMKLDYTYQRILSKNIKKLIEQWDDNKCEFLFVSYRDNKFFIIDGQHRYFAAKAKGIASLPCIIFTDLTKEQEALKFAQQNDNVTRLKVYDTYKANIANGDVSIPTVRTDMEINRICAKYKVCVDKSIKNKNLKRFSSISDARRIVSATAYNGIECFDWILGTITMSSWEMCPKAYETYTIRMLRNYYLDNVDELETAKQILLNIMNNISPVELFAMAKCNYPEYSMDTGLNLSLKQLIKEFKTL